MKKLKKRYYVLVLIFAVFAGMFLRSVENKSFEIVKNSTAYAPETDTQVIAAASETAEMININSADAEELKQLPGIGESLAKRIVAFRTKNGNFEVIQDIMKVDGIGEKTFNEIKNLICVE